MRCSKGLPVAPLPGGDTMRKLLWVLLVMVLTTAVLLACEPVLTCPVHDSPMSWTGQTKTVNGHQFGEYRCVRGEKYWVRCD
jgi:hypothetical protein